ncbi:MAG: hypothetical protein ACRDUW_06500 [Pseudonocardiaceae bacterium]
MDNTAVTAMGITGLTVFLAEGYLNNYQNWIVAKTHGTTYNKVSSTDSLWKWIFGLGMVSVVLVGGADSQEFGGVAKAFAAVIAVTAVLTKGTDAVKNLKGLVGG